MIFDLTFFAIAVPAVVFAGMSKGGFGSAASFAATPLLALILTPGQAIGLMLPLLMAMDVAAIKLYWRKWNWPVARRLIGGSVVGILIGWAIYDAVQPDVFRGIIGVIALGFVAFQIARIRGWIGGSGRPMSATWGGIWGSVLGLTSFISHAGGPPAAIYMLTLKLDKTTYQATSVLVFWCVNLLKLPAYVAANIFTKETLIADAMLVPVAILGVWIGAWLHNRVSDRLFFLLTYVFLTLTGFKLVGDALHLWG